jgi:hypothetical protein
MNRPDYNPPQRRSRQASERDLTTDADQDFWDIDPDELDRYLEGEPTHPVQSRAPRRSRASAPSEGGTAEQIDRLRESLARGGSGPRPSQQSLGRDSLSPSPRQPDPVQDDDVWDEEDQDQDWEPPATPRRTRITSDRDMLRQDPYVTDPWDDSGYDEDDRYYDDDDDFDEYDAPPRRTPLTQGPLIRLSRPNVTRPRLPTAISHADLVNDAPALAMIGLALVSLAGMAILVANRADTLSPSFATHVSASGVLENFRGPEALWRIPLLSAMLTLMNIGAAWFISPVDRFASRFLIAASIIVQIVAWVALIRIL